MSEVENKLKKNDSDQEIDLLELAQKIWAERKLIFKACGIAAVVGLVVAFSIPKEYSTAVLLAPEVSGKSNMGGMGALAAMAGVNLSNSSGADALSPDLYPQVVSSTPFLVDLFKVEVTDRKGKLKTTLYDYMTEHQRSPWWSAILSAPFKTLGWVISLMRDEGVDEGVKETDLFQLTQQEMGAVAALSNRIVATVDKKTGIISLSVTMQDPVISAALADTVMCNLQDCITEYRTNKARKDLAFAEKLYTEAKKDYYEAQKKFAAYSDGNQNVILQSFRTEQTRLQNEMNLAYNLYTQMAQQLQGAKAKVQEITPVYTVIQPASVPLRAAKPGKMMILIGFIFMAGVGSVGWILFGDIVKGFKKKSESATEEERAS